MSVKVSKSHKVLVANRSEVACRIFQACRELGIPSVGVVVPGDEEMRHVTYAGEIREVTSYLDSRALIEAALKSGATAITRGMVHRQGRLCHQFHEILSGALNLRQCLSDFVVVLR